MPASQKSASEILSPTFGGPGGSPFDHRPQASSGPIAQLTLHADSYIDAISITYGTLITGHGGPGGHPHTLTLQPGEYITQIEGSAGHWLDYLRFTTNLGHTLQAGGHGGKYFTVPNPEGHALHAILGRAGDFIDEIQFVFAPPPSAPKTPKIAAKKAPAKPKAEPAPKKAAAKKATPKPKAK